MKLIPVGERFILKPLEEKEEKVGSLYIPVSSNRTKASDTAVVIRGPHNSEVEIGDTVFFNAMTVKLIKFENANYLIAEKEDILAVINTEE